MWSMIEEDVLSTPFDCVTATRVGLVIRFFRLLFSISWAKSRVDDVRLAKRLILKSPLMTNFELGKFLRIFDSRSLLNKDMLEEGGL